MFVRVSNVLLMDSYVDLNIAVTPATMRGNIGIYIYVHTLHMCPFTHLFRY